ncbi:MAG TPA: Rab family GTPase [Candidatus Nanopelagicaceae bacterium]|nr:Rab family GTPase [Candidatus Nanopelagicaceae bacterium]
MLDAIFKIVIFGDTGCGKTTLTKRFKTDLFKSDSQMTIGVDFETITFEVDGKKVKLMIWDYGGEERFRFILPEYVAGAIGGILMYDITNYPSLAHIDYWLSVINGKNEQIPLVLLGGKADLEIIREIPFKEGKKIAKAKGFSGFTECSSKTGENVEKSFKKLTRMMLSRY